MPKRLRPLLALAPRTVPAASAMDRPQVFPAEGERRMRVALLPGCAQQVLAPEINEATIRLLTRHGCEVVVAPGSGCCGALVHHLGDEAPALAFARANIDAWESVRASGGLDAIVVNASGCGTMVKDYGFLLRTDPAYAEKAARIAALARDITEIVAELGLQRRSRGRPADCGSPIIRPARCSTARGSIARRGPCSPPPGFAVVEVPEGHLCCGSAGTYNLLQPELAAALRERKLANIALTRADLVAAGNIGCITQLAGDAPLPVVHTAVLLDWATGGPMPRGLPRESTRLPQPPARHHRDQQRQGQRGEPDEARPQHLVAPIRAAEQGLSAGRAEIGIGDRQRQLAEERADGVGAEPHSGQPQGIIGQAVRDDRHQPHHGDHAPAAVLGALEERRQPAPDRRDRRTRNGCSAR